MRKITREAKRAYDNNENYSNGNTMVTAYKEDQNGRKVVYKVSVFLHGNEIIHKVDSFGKWIEEATLAGWDTVTTRERLNGILGQRASFTQKKGKQFLNDKEIVDIEKWYHIEAMGAE